MGKVWDVAAEREVTLEELMGRLAAARFVLLGERHDNSEHHRLQARILEAMLRAGRSPALAMEQFDHQHQGALDTARRGGERDPDRIADAGRFDRKGWKWADYRPLVELALAHNLPIIAANLSREEAREIARLGRPAAGLGPAMPEQRAALERDLVEGHCGMRPETRALEGMIEAQRARDALMASSLEGAGERGAVLIAGAGHGRLDRGVPAYLGREARGGLAVVALVEVDGTVRETRRGVQKYVPEGYDMVVFTEVAVRDDPCEGFRGVRVP